MERMSVNAAREAAAIGREVRLQGWVRTRRDSKGGFSFLELNDGSSQAQYPSRRRRASCRTTKPRVKRLAAGCSVTVEGQVQAVAGQGAVDRSSCRADRRSRLGRSGGVSAAKERTIRGSSSARSPICGRAPTRSARSPDCGIRSAARSTIFFRSKAFSTSIRRSSPPATAKGPARCSRSRRSIWRSCRSRTGKIDFTHDFFHRPAYLTVSGQLNAEIFACALGKVYTFGPTFRAENSNTSRHLAEFWMVEPEMAFFELEDNMRLAEAFLERIFRDALIAAAEEMEFFRERIDKTVIDTLEGSSAAISSGCRTPRRSRSWRNRARSSSFRSPGASILQAEHERYLTEQDFTHR